MEKVKLDSRLEAIFKELDEKAYNSEFHNYNYKYTNQVIRKHFEALLCDGKSAVITESKCNKHFVMPRFSKLKKPIAATLLIIGIVAIIAFIVWQMYIKPLQSIDGLDVWYEYVVAIIVLTLFWAALFGIIHLAIKVLAWAINAL